MLTTPTVFVLGAGASAPFMFPTGYGLAQHIIRLEQDNDPVFIALSTVGGYEPEAIYRLSRDFSRSGNISIDAFLEYRRDLIEIGRAAIAAALVGYEQASRLFEHNEKNWLQYMFVRLNTAPERFNENTISFVTFNYDRSLEYFLFQALKNCHNLKDEEAAALVNKIEIIHLHGRLGFLPWQHAEGREYHHIIDGTTIAACVAQIKIIHEDPTDRDQDFERAKKLLMDAAQIRFLGLGYNSVNLQRLGVHNLPDNDIRGSGLGMTDHEAAGVKKHGPITTMIHQDCIGLLRNYVNWE